MRITNARLRYAGVCLLLAIGTSFSTVASAGPGVWTSGGPYGGGVGPLTINPANPATLYAAGGGDGVFKSTDSGATWSAVNTGLTSLSVYALAIHPASPATLYAGTAAGIFKSADSGVTWFPSNRGIMSPSVTALAIHPVNPAILYAGTNSGGVFKSTDSGGTWVSSGLTNESVFELVIDPATPGTLYAGTFYDGVFKSTDAGGTWVPHNAGLSDPQVFALAIDPATPSALYAGTARGFFRSTDSGGTWAASTTDLSDQAIWALAIDPSNPSTLYAGAWTLYPGRQIGTLFKSTDSGVTWSNADGGLTAAGALALAIDPTNPRTLYVGTLDTGVFKSTDSGGTWLATSAGLTGVDVTSLAIDPATPRTVYAGTFDTGVFKSTDAGAKWSAASSGLTDLHINSLAVNPASPATVYAGTGGGVFKSSNSGGIWAAANTGLPANGIGPLAVNPVDPSILYAVGGGVFKSTDAGGTWAARNSGLTDLSILCLALNAANPAVLYAGAFSGIFRSTDAGATWASTGFPGAAVFALAIDPSNPSTLFAGTLGAVFKSTDGGGTWAAKNTGLTQSAVMGPIRSLIFNPANPSTVYVGTSSGVFKSVDSGSTWAPVNKGLPPLYVRALALDPSGSTTLYAGLLGGSVWQATPPIGSDIVTLLPASAHASGAGGAFYTTDVSVSNVGSVNASFTLKFLGNDQDGSSGPEQTFSLEAGKSRTFVDILGSVFNTTSGFGAIRITPSTPLLDVVSVTSTPGFGGTFGQTIPAVSSSDLIPANSARSVLYIREADGFRSNLILVSGAAVSTNVDVALVSPAGETLATKTYSMPPNGMKQINRIVRDMGVTSRVTGARLVLSSGTPGALFTGVVSVIDETTNDPTTMAAQPPMNPGPAFGTTPVGPGFRSGFASGVEYLWLLPASAHTRGLGGAFYTTNLAIANVGFEPASFTLRFLGHDQDGSNGAARTFTLESGKSVTYFDVLGSVFNETSSFGAIRITSSSRFLNVVSVTSTPGFGGSLGQTIPALTPVDFIRLGSSRSILSVREGDGFRTNLILASAAALSTTVDVALVSAAGITLATKSYSVPPNGMTQINRVVRDMGISGAVTGARLVLSTSTPTAFTGFASVIDETTNDPTTMEAK